MELKALDYQNVRLLNLFGRMGRLRFFAYSLILPFYLSLIPLTIEMVDVFNFMTSEGTGDPRVMAKGISKALASGVLNYIAAGTLISIIAGVQRLHDLSFSGWWSILQIVPLILVMIGLKLNFVMFDEFNLLSWLYILFLIPLVTIILCFFPGNLVSNQYGLPSKKNTWWLWTAVFFPIFLLMFLVLTLYIFD